MRFDSTGVSGIALERRISEDPEWLPLAWRIYQKLKAKEFDRALVEAFMQGLYSPDVSGMLLWGDFFSRLYQNHILGCGIAVGSSPKLDAARTVNQAAVSMLPFPFQCVIDDEQHNAESDGYLEWTEPVTISSVVATGEVVSAVILPGTAPLEVGDTRAERSTLHLGSECALARWPYDSDIIYLFAVVQDPDRPPHLRRLYPTLSPALSGGGS